MTLKPLYSEEITFLKHSHTFITEYHEARLKVDKYFIRNGLLVETKNKFYEQKVYDKLPLNNRQYATIANKHLLRDLDNDEDNCMDTITFKAYS